MTENLLLYYITDRSAFPGDESDRSRRLLDKISEAASAGIDRIQLREKDLSTRDLESLAREAASLILKTAMNRKVRTKLLINSRADVALSAGADGVHLRSDDISPKEVRTLWRKAACVAGVHKEDPLIGASCHTLEELQQAEENGADFAVFAPVFEKKGVAPAGLDRLREACHAKIPVLALGGITLENAHSCLEAGAAGIAAIRLFQEYDVAEVVRNLRRNQ